ncbi:hypothetical protein BV898_05715, partial [Hypsibius exemplaris]
GPKGTPAGTGGGTGGEGAGRGGDGRGRGGTEAKFPPIKLSAVEIPDLAPQHFASYDREIFNS